ncbi:hypothetical protein HIM_01393 [Hirsutella minnesotensis 3608]|nr:hypothetical protein HIM_01393 [Hirsutella minnesotensis 3608]
MWLEFRHLWKRKKYTGVLVGVDGCGKTTLLYRWKLGKIISTIPTIALNVETLPRGGGVDIVILDPGGCDKLRALVGHYFVSAQFIIFIHDCAAVDRLGEQLEEFKRAINSMIEHGIQHVWIAFNKLDLIPAHQRFQHLATLKETYSEFANRFTDSLALKMVNLPGLSSPSANDLDILQDIKQTLQDHLKFSKRPEEEAEAGPWSKIPSIEELTDKAKHAVLTDCITPELFWQSVENGEIVWNHYNHLKAGYFIMIDGFAVGKGGFESASVFIKQLKRLSELYPQRFSKKAHRTMTTFWMHQLQAASLKYKHEAKLQRPLSRTDWGTVLMYSPQLLHSGLWKEFYSKDRLSCLAASIDWLPPDLKALPSLIAFSEMPDYEPDTLIEESTDQLIGLALDVAQNTLGANDRRGAVIKSALSSLQASIQQQRAVNSATPPYSETQAYFWIQFVHASLASFVDLDHTTSSMTRWSSSEENLTVPAFKALFNINGKEWRKYYSPAKWQSPQARGIFTNPDLKPLPDIVGVLL